MNKVKFILFTCLLVISTSLLARNSDGFQIQINGKYLSLEEAVAAKSNLQLETRNNKLEFKFGNSYYPINSASILLLFGRNQLTIDFVNTYSNAKIYLDNYLQGTTNSKGAAHFPQIYPESGPHEIKIKVPEISIPSFKFKLKQPATIFCSGKKEFHYEKQLM